MSDWQKGDLALCVWGDNDWQFGHDHPRPGSVNTVRGVGVDEDGDVGIWLEEFPGEENIHGFIAEAFRRIPPHAPDAEDAETIRLLNGKPVRVGESA